MAHIHPLIDFAVTVCVVNQERVAFIKHKKLGIWLPPGGHVEPDEDPEQACLREIREEIGLDIHLVGKRPAIAMPNGRMLIAPAFVDRHRISPTHEHIGLLYFARAASDQLRPAEGESTECRWFTPADLDDPAYDLLPHIRFYALEAIKRC